MTDLSIDGETFRIEVDGAADRPTVLLSSPLGGDLTLWDAQMPALLERFRVVRYDPRGHGRSTVHGAPFPLARLGQDVLAILDRLAIETTHFVGMSMGGAVGQWLLVNAPERIARAVLCNTGARLGTADVWNARIALVLSQGMDSLAAGTMERWFGAAFRDAQPDRVAAVEAVFRKTPPEGYAACCAALRDMDLREALHAIARPVLVVTGRDDPVTSAADVAAMTRAIRGAQHVELDCRHISNIEAEAAFNAAVIGFLSARTPTRLARPRPPRKHAVPSRRPTRGRATAARSPLKPPAPAAAATPRGRKPGAAAAAAKASPAKRTATKRTLPKSTAKAASGASARKGTTKAAAEKPPTKKPAATRATAGRAASKPPARRTIAKTAASERSPVAKKRATKKGPAKKASTKAVARKLTPARRPSGKKPGRPGGRRRR